MFIDAGIPEDKTQYAVIGTGLINVLMTGISVSPCLILVPISRVPTAQGKQGEKNPCQGKHREFGNFAKTQGILFAQFVKFLILKVKDIAIFAMIISIFSRS